MRSARLPFPVKIWLIDLDAIFFETVGLAQRDHWFRVPVAGIVDPRAHQCLLTRLIEAQGADVAEGDFLCIHTGFGDLLLRDGEHVRAEDLAACPGLDGTDKALLDWIDRSGLAAICADNSMVEKLEGVTRCDGKTVLPLHGH